MSREATRLEASRRWPPEAWIPLLAGVYWLWRAPEHGLLGFLFSIIPGCLLLGSGVSMLVMPGDRRIAQFTALGGVAGVLLALPAFLVVGVLPGLLLVLASAPGGVIRIKNPRDTRKMPAAIVNQSACATR